MVPYREPGTSYVRFLLKNRYDEVCYKVGSDKKKRNKEYNYLNDVAKETRQ